MYNTVNNVNMKKNSTLALQRLGKKWNIVVGLHVIRNLKADIKHSMYSYYYRAHHNKERYNVKRKDYLRFPSYHNSSLLLLTSHVLQ